MTTQPYPVTPTSAQVAGAGAQPAHPGLRYMSAYPAELQIQVGDLIATGKLANHLRKRYPVAHGVRSDKALYDYLTDLRSSHLRKNEALSKVVFDSKIHVVRHALGLHTSVSRVQGSKLKAKHEIRIASFFRQVPLEFLRMIAVHELAHIKEKAHDKAFYQLCQHMEPHYHQLEFDVRLYLTWLEHTAEPLW